MEQLDKTDIRILRILQKDAKKTTKEIAELLNLSVSPVYERIRKMEKEGYIQKYVAILDKKLLKRSITAFCQVSIKLHNETSIETFEAEVIALEEVQECYHLAGDVDFLLKINMESLEEYHTFLRQKLSKIPNISTLNTTFVLKESKHSSELFF
ncbi:MAG TPA: Lrp/AsnC family transcriptional regulator [Chitinophaga sp.]|uniref:Lrp/AsnC family transcriptional regulator n=1 Tax=Chitinophaga sp. TaxID=1869181 RepID=UPI002CCC54E3|nr:Lrp/AsnC family transcriptional regulator [Chitinophaga sp.]HVI47506.1 Lrp/AsnC family transcriptional regulator [Chitinophaga sp.]